MHQYQGSGSESVLFTTIALISMHPSIGMYVSPIMSAVPLAVSTVLFSFIVQQGSFDFIPNIFRNTVQEAPVSIKVGILTALRKYHPGPVHQGRDNVVAPAAA